MKIFDELLSLVDALSAAEVPYAICGGIAVAIPGYPRFTKDIDLIVLRTDTELLLKSRRVVPARLMHEGFNFRFPEWPAAARSLVAALRAR